MAGENIDNLLVGLGLDVDKQSFDNGISQFNAVRGAALGLSAVIAGGIGAASMAREFASSRQELGNFADQMEVSAQGVSGLEFAFEQVGGRAEEARQTIERMRQFQDSLMRRDPGALNAMSMMGLDPRAVTQAEDAVQAVERVTQAMQGMDEQRRRVILQDMGIDSGAAFRLFGQGAEQLQSYMDQSAELAPVTASQIEASRDFQKSLNELKTSVQGVTDIIAMDLLPNLTAMSDALGSWITDNRELLSEVTTGFEKSGDNWLKENGLGFLARDVGEFIPFFEGNDNPEDASGGSPGTSNEPMGSSDSLKENSPLRGEFIPLFKGNDNPEEASGVSPGTSNEPMGSSDSLKDNRALREAVSQLERDIGAPKGLLWAQIGQESSYNPNAVSDAGARGLAQIMPDTERSLEKRFGEQMNPFDPMDAIRMQGELMRENYESSGDWDEALRMYHGGWDKSNWGPVNKDYAPSIRSRMSTQGESNQSIVNQNVSIQIDGAGDANQVALQIDRRLKEHARRASDDYRSSVV